MKIVFKLSIGDFNNKYILHNCFIEALSCLTYLNYEPYYVYYYLYYSLHFLPTIAF